MPIFSSKILPLLSFFKTFFFISDLKLRYLGFILLPALTPETRLGSLLDGWCYFHIPDLLANSSDCYIFGGVAAPLVALHNE